MEPITQEQLDAFSRAKIGLLQRPDSIFITSVLFSLTNRWDDSIPTACTNGINIDFNPDFFFSLDFQERQTLLAHEAWHVAFKHMARSLGLDAQVFNEAADHVINLMLKQSGFKALHGWLCDDRFRGMSTMEVYHILMSEKQSAPQPSPSSTPQGGNGAPTPFGANDIQQISNSDPDADAKEAEISDIIVRANLQKTMHEEKTGKSCGSLPGEIETLIDSLLNPKLPWNEILQNFMIEFDKCDYSFKKPNRRYFPEFYLPSLYSESMAEIALAFDTSCSVTNHELKQYDRGAGYYHPVVS